MQYRTDPRSGNRLSALGFGCMRFSKSLSASFGLSVGKPFDERKVEELLVNAIDRGINYFDTAYLYAGSEEILGSTLQKHGLRDKVYIATKFPLMFAKKAEDLDSYFETELERLQTDHVDYYLFHMLSDLDTWDKLCDWGVGEWIAAQKAAGQIRQIGFSFHGARDTFLKLLDVHDWDFCQIQLNYSDENFQAGVTGLEAAAAKGIPVMIMEPLLGGQLSAGLPDEAVKRFRDDDPRLSPSAWGLRWVWNHPEVTVVLSGMNEMAQLEENVRTVEDARPGILSERELAAYRDVKQMFNASYKVHCTGCHYCMPCPAGVNIPGCFSAYNTYHSISRSTATLQYGMTTLLSGDPSYASLCRKCGKCETQCPQHLPIRRYLEDVQSTMETPRFRIMKTFSQAFMNRGGHQAADAGRESGTGKDPTHADREAGVRGSLAEARARALALANRGNARAKTPVCRGKETKTMDNDTDGKSTLIYCFSGTGNSLALAGMVADHLGNTRIRGMMTLQDDPTIPREYDRIGFVLPTCFGHPPKAVTEVAEKLIFASHQRVFIIVTCGGGNILTLSDLWKQLEPKTAHAIQGFSVRLPGNHLVGFGAWSDKRQQQLFEGAKKAAADIAHKIVHEVPTAKGVHLPLPVATYLSETFNGRLGVENIHSMVPLYYTTDACTRCGVCARICPVGNITVTEDGVEFGDDCQQCMACIQWCPQHAIGHPNVPADRKRYHHPDVDLETMLLLNDRGGR